MKKVLVIILVIVSILIVTESILADGYYSRYDHNYSYQRCTDKHYEYHIYNNCHNHSHHYNVSRCHY